ncbi:hypothetical protein E5288_WYG019483 [Bos mutus]|uniref:Uncharacterized protein n=1 Tax=Bos mutus TaxID=72004 RepID=A0A6B0RMU7_9CETA|nr:hypothetical protein [Bos mutus]
MAGELAVPTASWQYGIVTTRTAHPSGDEGSASAPGSGHKESLLTLDYVSGRGKLRHRSLNKIFYSQDMGGISTVENEADHLSGGRKVARGTHLTCGARCTDFVTVCLIEFDTS